MESRSLLERISARIEGSRPGVKPHTGRPVRDVLSPEYDGDDSPGLPPCSQQLDLSDSEEEEPKKHLGYHSSNHTHFRFPEEKARSSVNVSDSSDEDFENFLIQLNTPKHAPTKPPGSSLKDFIVDSEDDDFDSMFSKGGKGTQSRIGKKTSVSLSPVKAAVSSQWKDSPVFISDSDEDSIVIKSTWSNRHTTNPKPKDKGQRAKSLQKNTKENLLRPPNHQSSGRPASTESSKVAEPKFRTPVSSDDEFESLLDRIKNRTKNQTPGSTARKENPKSALTEPVKGPCLDLTNKKKTEPKLRPQSCSDTSKSPYFPPDKPATEPRDDEEKSYPGKTGFPCKVEGCFLNDLSHPTSQYVKDFKQKKHGLATRLYSLYNHTIFDEKLPDNLEILWNKKMRKTAGYCVTGQKKVPVLQRYARIELSEKVCDSADRLRDTLIHEICHAATWLINGVRDGHGQYWRFYARKATLIHPELPMVTRCHTYEINYKFTYECSRCKNTIGRHSKSLDTERFVCALCKGKLVLQTATRKDGSPANTQLTPFAKFVKENYGSTKKEMTGMSHAEVMRKLSADFSSKAKISA